MSYAHLLVLLSAGISLVGATAYIRDTLAGRTRPNLVSWSMWALAPLVGVGAAMHAGAEPWATVRIFLAGFIPLVVVFASLANKQRYWQLSAFDVLCGAFSLLALITWLGVDSPRVAILLAVA